MTHPHLLKAIALQAGVSLATVDRVVHQRPGVRTHTERRVQQAMAELERQSAQVGLQGRKFIVDLVMQAPERFTHVVRDALERGEAVKLSGFGNFQLRDKPQRPGRNPKTGEEIPITARRVVTFHASQKLKGMVDSVGNQPLAHAA